MSSASSSPSALAPELVEDRESRRPFDSSLKLAERVRIAALEAGLICYPTAGTVDGFSGDHVLLSPPYIVTRAELDEIVDVLASTLDKVVAEVCRSSGIDFDKPAELELSGRNGA